MGGCKVYAIEMEMEFEVFYAINKHLTQKTLTHMHTHTMYVRTQIQPSP